MSETNTSDHQSTIFSNDTISAPLITTEVLTLVSLSPKYRRINLIWAGGVGIVLILILSVLSADFFFTLPEDSHLTIIWAYAGISAFTIWRIVYHYFADPLKRYALREHDLNYQSGLIFRKLVSQPILRIQHIEIKRGPIERKAGLATLQVFSAGGVSHTFNIPGLEHENAIALRQFILDHKDLAADA